MPIEWSGLAPELLLTLDRRSGDPPHSHDLRRRVTLRDEPGAANGDSSTPDLLPSQNSSLPLSAVRQCAESMPSLRI